MEDVSWFDAQNECEAFGGHLWSANSHEEWIDLFETWNWGQWNQHELEIEMSTYRLLNQKLIFIGLISNWQQVNRIY